MVEIRCRDFICLLIMLFCALPAQCSLAYTPQVAPSTQAADDLADPLHVLNALQRSAATGNDTFVLQSELDCLIAEDGGGACASAVAIDALQALRVMSGLDVLANPHKEALSAFENQPILLKGRVRNDTFVNLLKFYAHNLEGKTISIDVESAPNSSYSQGDKVWDRRTGPELTIRPQQLKILSFTVTEPTGKVIGRHFVILKRREHNTIDVVDPKKPLKDHSYVLQFSSGESQHIDHVFLLNPAGAPARTNTYELNTVFSISVEENFQHAHTGSNSASIDEIKKRIDEVAKELRDKPEYLNPRVWREKTANVGLPGLDLPTEYGGANYPATAMLEVFAHAGAHNLNFRDIVGGAHVRPLLKSTTPEVLDIVRKVASGNGYIAIAVTEPDVGSDVTAMKSISRKVPGGYMINGSKRFNARLEQATDVIIFTQGTTGVEGKLNVFVLPIDWQGLKKTQLVAHGLKGNSYGGLEFKEVFVPEKLRVGADGEGGTIFYEHFLYWRLMQTAAAIGTGENALQQMANRIKARQAFGGPIGRFTHLQQPIGQHAIELKMARALAREAAELIDKGDYKSARPLICGLKAEGVEIALKAVDAATRAFGGEGYSEMVDLGDRLRDLNGLRIADGTTDVMRMEVVRRLYGDEFWQMAIEKKK